MIERSISKKIIELSKEYPVILVQGPRQSGKTTVCRNLFPNKPYVLLENPDVRIRAIEDPRGFLAEFSDGAILDEVQRVPELISYIQGIVDERNSSGMFILTGSNNLLLMEAVSQTLAGRVAIFSLLPFSMKETLDMNSFDSMEKRILYGGYPRLIVDNMNKDAFFENYISTYVEKDVRQVLKIKDSDLFRRFVQLVAERIGSMIDISSLAGDCGISTKTANEWLSILETSFICFRLPPYFVNRTKRLVKTPKLYFYDTGLACALLGISDEKQLAKDRLKGSLFENLVILEFLKDKYNLVSSDRLYFYRTSDGIEVDLVKQEGRNLTPIEIKFSSTFFPEWVKGISKFKEEYSDESSNGIVIYSGKDSFSFKSIEVKNFLSI